MTSDRSLSRPKFGVCFAAALFAIAPASSRPRRRRRAIRRRMGGASGPAVVESAIGRRPIRNTSTCPRKRGRSTLATLRSPTRSCAPRSASTFPASPTARRASSHWRKDGRRIETIEVSVGSATLADLTDLLNAAIPGNDIRVRTGRGQDHPHRIRRVGRRGPEGARYRVRLRQRCDPCVAVGSRRRLHFRRLQRLRAQ